MTKIALMDKPISQLTARSTVAGTDRLPIFTSTGTEAQAATVDQIVASASGILDNNNAFTGNNTFAGTSGFNGAVDIGKSGTAGSLDIFPATASKGKLTIACTNQTGDTTVTLNANAMGQASTINIADPGIAASYLLQSTAAITVAEANVLYGATAGTQVASKAVVADANVNIGSTKITALYIGTSGSETQVNSTAAELNRLDDSAEVETIDSGVAASVTKFNTIIDNTTTGTGAITLDVCPATMVGKIKTIRMGVDSGDVTLDLTNVQGQTSGTTATFNDVGDELILVGSSGGKWTVIKELGITLS